MLISERHNQIILALQKNPQISVAQLSQLLHFSEPTIRRDLTELHRQGIVTKCYGGAILNQITDNREVPFVLRENEKSQTKAQLGLLASQRISDGMTIMLDASTSAYHLVPYLAKFKDITVITNGAKTAVALGQLQIPVYCIGGRMFAGSFAFLGSEAEDQLRRFRADAMFFSCRGLTLDGVMTDPSPESGHLGRVMQAQSQRSYLLCDSSKFGNTYLYEIGSVATVDDILSDAPLPSSIAAVLNSGK